MIHVVKVITKPHEKIFKPRLRYFRYNFFSVFCRFVAREKLSVNDIPTKRRKIVAVARAK